LPAAATKRAGPASLAAAHPRPAARRRLTGA
jgi:hypothetical protein